MIELFNEDCMEGMKRYPDKYFELAIVDPPYGHGHDVISNNASRGKLAIAKDYGNGEWNNAIPTENYWLELFRISNNQIIWGGNFFSLCPSQGWIVWDKVNYENDFADCELAWTSFDRAIRQFTFQWNGMLQGDMKNKEIRIHPTQKPVKLYEWLLKNYAKQGDKILDTHLGSGSIAIACYNLDFSLTGFEIDKDYYDGACNRLEEHKKQGRLFG
jgi:site-specific DNA-methyltransferase (adenine-specific)